MSIIRRQRETFSVIDNRIINDERLNLKALGLLVYMLSKPNDWEFNQENLGRTWGEGRDAMRAVFKILRHCGYLRTEVARNAQGHVRTVTIISELPSGDVEIDGLTGGRETRRAVDPSGGEPIPLLKTESYQELILLNTEVISVKGDFERFWEGYPRKVGKPKAKIAFERASRRDTFQNIMVGLGAAIENWPDPQFIPHPTTWLNRDGWNDEHAKPTNNRGGRASGYAGTIDAFAAANEILALKASQSTY